MLIGLITKNAQPIELGIRQFLTSGDPYITHFCHKTLLYSPLPGSPHWLVDYEHASNIQQYPIYIRIWNKANLRDLIAATGLVILLKLDANYRFFSHGTLKFDWWHIKIIGHLFYITSSFVHHLKPLGEFKLQLLSGNAQYGSKSTIFCPVWPWNSMDDLEKQ